MGLDYFITCGLRHTRIYTVHTNSFVHSENIFWSALQNAGKLSELSATLLQRFQASPSARFLFNTEQRRSALAAFSNNNAVFFLDQSTQHFDIGPYKTTFRKHCSNIGSHIYVACLTAIFVLFPLYPLRPIESASCRPQVDDFPFSIISIIRLLTIQKLFRARSPRQPM